MFGIDNTGVINQKNAPAIWESDFADFPANTIKGRFLLALDTITLYVDLITSNNPTNRAVVASGLIGDGSGTTINNNGTGDYTVDLGGTLFNSANIDLNNFEINLNGLQTSTIFRADGYIEDLNNGSYFPAVINNLTALIPDKILAFTNLATGDVYKVLAKLN